MRPRWPRWPLWRFGSGPAVARLYQRLLALVSLIAWLSLGAQVRVLFGSRGLLPVAELMDAVQSVPGISILSLPTLFWRFHSDGALVAGVILGALASIAALAGIAPRICFALSTALYLSFALVGRDFLSFQWDNLLLECGFLGVFLRADRPAPLVHFLFRVVLFKLYFESGIAKWQSSIRDWQDGSAMTYYYETAPLPTWLGYYAHHLPAWWHHFESRATLVLELGVPFAIFGPRRTRLAALGIFTAFQIANAATANYGFFCYLAVVVSVFLLDDPDLDRASARLAPAVPAPLRRFFARWRALGRVAAPSDPRRPARWLRARRWAGRVGAALLVALSLLDGLDSFTEGGPLLELASPLTTVSGRLRLVNTYHLFGSITRERIEPELQTLNAGRDPSRHDADRADDDAWTAQNLWHKPGDVRRAPDFVAPHQPRVDFQLWFYGLGFRRGRAGYVATLVERMCEDPSAVQPLFRTPLPPGPAAVRLVFWRYHFTSRAEKRQTGAWWRRAPVAMTPPIPCPRATP